MIFDDLLMYTQLRIRIRNLKNTHLRRISCTPPETPHSHLHTQLRIRIRNLNNTHLRRISCTPPETPHSHLSLKLVGRGWGEYGRKLEQYHET